MNARSLIIAALLIGLGAAILAGGAAHGQAPKRGGILNAMLGEDPPGTTRLDRTERTYSAPRGFVNCSRSGLISNTSRPGGVRREGV